MNISTDDFPEILGKSKYKKRFQGVQVFYGKFRLPWKQQIPSNLNSTLELEKEKVQKVVVFDLDETLGSFGDLYILWAGIQHIIPEYLNFDYLLDLYPEFIRYGIFPILNFLYQKKKSKECSKIYIYTNNQCPNKWISYLLQYFQNKVQPGLDLDPKIPLFDNIIGAFKIRNRRIEISRTSHAKSYQDFIRCTLLPPTTEICFLDDTEYNKMKNDKIYYICPQSYVHSLSVQTIIQRLIHSDLWKGNRESEILNSEDFWINWFQIHGRNDSEYVFIDMQNIHLKIGQKMMYYVKEFFLLSTKKDRFFGTRKRILGKSKMENTRKNRKKIK